MTKYLLVLGAGNGISYATAKKFGDKGFQIVLIARSEENLKNLTTKLNQENIPTMYFVTDISNTEDFLHTFFEIKAQWGMPEVLLYNAAAITIKDILEQSWDSIQKDLAISVGGFFNLMKEILPYYLERNEGKILITGGGFALKGDDQFTSLSIGKAALRNLVQAFQKKVKNTKIHIAQLTICGFLSSEDKKYNPKSIAEQYWNLYQQDYENQELEIIY